MYGIKKATVKEIKIYKKLSEKIYGLSGETFEKAIKEINNFVQSHGKERKRAYDRLRKWAKKMNCKVVDFETWYSLNW